MLREKKTWVMINKKFERKIVNIVLLVRLTICRGYSKEPSHRVHIDVASDVGVNLCNVKSCLNTSNNEIFTDKRGDLPCVNISKHTCPVVK